jgi:hypothetical protein
MDAFAQKNGLVKDKFKADEGEPDGRNSTPPSRPSGWSEGKSLAPKDSPSSRDVGASGREASTKGKEGTQKDVSALDGPPREDVELSPPNEALLRELEAPSPPEGDWLEDPVNVPAGEAVDDLDVVLTQGDPVDQQDPTDITQIFHREDDLFGPNGAEPAAGPSGSRKAALPGLPGKRGGKTVPPPLPAVDPPRPGRKG